jgi:23S rRNA pseudouridine1911/1915/1917 synthase
MDQCPSAFHLIVESFDDGKRLDALIAVRVPECARTVAAKLIRDDLIRVGGEKKKAGYRVRIGDEISVVLPPAEATSSLPEAIPLQVLYEDAAIVVIDKQPGLVVHPSPGHPDGTLVNALLHHCPGLEAIGGEMRPGIVHRLDRDTSGTMVIAKNAVAMRHLSEQFKERIVRKEYLALVYGVPLADSGSVSLAIGRDAGDRKRMSTKSRKTRSALTEWRVLQRYVGAALLEIRIRTGRTHQIRVHCAAIAHPILGDPVYGGRKKMGKIEGISPTAQSLVASAGRQLLHAWRLQFVHPATNEIVRFESSIPQDMVAVMDALKGAL